MRQFLSLVLLLLLAYGGSRVNRKRPHPSWMDHIFATGFVFCVIGFLLGPSGTGLVSESMLNELLPLIIFSLGWVGFLVGMQADLSLLSQVPRRYLEFTVVESSLTIATVTVVIAVVFAYLGLSGTQLLLVSLTAGACAGVSSQAVPALAAKRSRDKGTLFLKVVTGLDDYPTTILTLILFAFVSVDGRMRSLAAGGAWIGITIALGLGFGLLFYLLLRPRAKFDETLAICLGVTILSSGAAAYLCLAVPAVGFLAGLFVANAPTVKKQTFYNVLTVAERPIVFSMFLMAGAHVKQASPWWLIPLAVFVVVRGVIKVVAGRNLTGWLSIETGNREHAGWALIAPGPLSIAIALDYHCVQHGPYSDVVLWTVTGGAVLGELIVPLAVSRLKASDPDKAEAD